MFDMSAFYSIFKSIVADKAKEEHKPSLSNMESMKAYQEATKATGRACFTDTQSNMGIDYV